MSELKDLINEFIKLAAEDNNGKEILFRKTQNALKRLRSEFSRQIKLIDSSTQPLREPTTPEGFEKFLSLAKNYDKNIGSARIKNLLVKFPVEIEKWDSKIFIPFTKNLQKVLGALEDKALEDDSSDVKSLMSYDHLKESVTKIITNRSAFLSNIARLRETLSDNIDSIDKVKTLEQADVFLESLATSVAPLKKIYKESLVLANTEKDLMIDLINTHKNYTNKDVKSNADFALNFVRSLSKLVAEEGNLSVDRVKSVILTPLKEAKEEILNADSKETIKNIIVSVFQDNLTKLFSPEEINNSAVNTQ